MPLPTPQNNNPSRLEQLFRTAQERQDLLTDDEIRNIVHKEAQPLSTPTTPPKPFIPRFQGVISLQRLLTTFMISAAILTSVVGFTFLFMSPQKHGNNPQTSQTQPTQIQQQYPTKALHESPAKLTAQAATKSVIPMLTTARTRERSSTINNTQSPPFNTPRAVEGLRVLELSDGELANLGIVIDALGGIFQAKRRPATGLESYAATLLPTSQALSQKDTALRLDMVAVLPKLSDSVWRESALGTPFQRLRQIADSMFQEEMRNPDLRFYRNVPQNSWNEERLSHIRQQHKQNEQAFNTALAKTVEAEVLYEKQVFNQHPGLFQTLTRTAVPKFQVMFIRATDGSEWLAPKAKSGHAMLSFTFTNESLADSLAMRIEEAKTQEESDSAEAQLRRLFRANRTQEKQLSDSAFAVHRQAKLQQLKDSTPTERLLGIKVQRGENALVLWCTLTNELTQALPDRYRVPLERELAAAAKYSSLCEIPTREEREELEQIIAGKPFLETWRSCSGALTAKNISPNPAQNDVTTRFVLTAPRTVSAALHDIRGVHLETLTSAQNLSAGEHQLSLTIARHPAGMYLLVLTTQQGEQTVQRVMIEK